MATSNRQIKFWGLLSSVLIVGLVFLAGSQYLQSQRVQAVADVALDQRLIQTYVVDATDLGRAGESALTISGWSPAEVAALEQEEAWSDVLQVRVNLPDIDAAELPPVVGDYSVAADRTTLLFTPRYGWSPGQGYITTLDLELASTLTEAAPAPDALELEQAFFVPAIDPPDAPLAITKIYPTANEVPENLLRFYVEFSQPMQRGNVYDVVRLLDANGDEVEWPFLRIGQEFWDRDMQVLTIILDPGRIKQGVAPNVEAGAPLVNDGRYELVIGSGLTDAYGRILTDDVIKPFTVVAPDHQSPDPTRWMLNQPDVNSKGALTINMDGAIDPILAPHLIRVEDQRGQSVATTFSFDEDEQTLIITPDNAWEVGDYRVAVHPTLEDYAGNRVESVFDMAPGTVADLAETANERLPVYIDFQIRDLQ
ncbi:MAG: Ig-like domain-containing protein [Chloroflexota bacterium]